MFSKHRNSSKSRRWRWWKIGWVGWHLTTEFVVVRIPNWARNDNCDHAVANLIFIHVELDASYKFTHSSVRHLCKKMDVLFIRIACFKISSCLRSHPQKITQTICCCAHTEMRKKMKMSYSFWNRWKRLFRHKQRGAYRIFVGVPLSLNSLPLSHPLFFEQNRRTF